VNENENNSQSEHEPSPAVPELKSESVSKEGTPVSANRFMALLNFNNNKSSNNSRGTPLRDACAGSGGGAVTPGTYTEAYGGSLCPATGDHTLPRPEGDHDIRVACAATNIDTDLVTAFLHYGQQQHEENEEASVCPTSLLQAQPTSSSSDSALSQNDDAPSSKGLLQAQPTSSSSDSALSQNDDAPSSKGLLQAQPTSSSSDSALSQNDDAPSSKGVDMVPPDVTNMHSGTRGPAVVEDAQPGWFQQHHHPSAMHQYKPHHYPGQQPLSPNIAEHKDEEDEEAKNIYGGPLAHDLLSCKLRTADERMRQVAAMERTRAVALAQQENATLTCPVK
jgi:hypothetical protein